MSREGKSSHRFPGSPAVVFGEFTGRNLQVIRYKTGLKIRQTGIYTVYHAEHRLPHEVTLLKGETFPRCSRCGTSVEFELLRAAPEINASGWFRVVLYELPASEIEEQPDAESA